MWKEGFLTRKCLAAWRMLIYSLKASANKILTSKPIPLIHCVGNEQSGSCHPGGVRWISPWRFLQQLTQTHIHNHPDGAFHGISEASPGNEMPFSPSFFGGKGCWCFACSQILIAGKFYGKPKFYGKSKTAVVDPTSSSPTSSLYSVKGRRSCCRIHATCPRQYPT